MAWEDTLSGCVWQWDQNLIPIGKLELNANHTGSNFSSPVFTTHYTQQESIDSLCTRLHCGLVSWIPQAAPIYRTSLQCVCVCVSHNIQNGTRCSLDLKSQARWMFFCFSLVVCFMHFCKGYLQPWHGILTVSKKDESRKSFNVLKKKVLFEQIDKNAVPPWILWSVIR